MRIAGCLTAAALLGMVACTPFRSSPSAHPSAASTELSPAGTPPAFLLGRFKDDYGGRPLITAARWEQGPGTVYLPVTWEPDSQFVIARNAPDNLTAPGAWTRIDWMRLEGMPPFTWAYCLSAFDAPTADSARRTRIADRSAPRTGCNGFPFTRLEPIR